MSKATEEVVPENVVVIDENNIDEVLNEAPDAGEPGLAIRLTDEDFKSHEESLRTLHHSMTSIMEDARKGDIAVDEANTQWDRMDEEFKAHRQAIDGHKRFLDQIDRLEKRVQDRAESLNRIPQRTRNSMIAGGQTVNIDGLDFRDLHDRQQDSGHRLNAGMTGWFKAQNGVRSQITQDEVEAARDLGFSPMDENLFIPLLDDNSYQVVRDVFLAEMEGASENKGSQRRHRSRAYEAMKNALHTGTGGGENVLFGSTFIGRLEEAILAYEGLIRSVEVIRTQDGSPWYEPTTNDTGNEGRMIDEATALPAAAGATMANVVPTFAQFVLNAYLGTSDMVVLSNSVLEDNSIGLATKLPEMLGRRIGRLRNKKGTIGTGTNEPTGLATAAANSGVTVAVASIAFTDLIDLQHEVDPGIRENRECKYMAHDQTIKALKKLVDGDGRPLWMVDYRNGAPDVIDGHGYVVNQNMAQMGANNRSVLFGDFQSYKWRDVVGPGSNAGMRLRKLVELFAQSDQTAYAALCRFDGDLKNAGDDPVQALIHPAS